MKFQPILLMLFFGLVACRSHQTAVQLTALNKTLVDTREVLNKENQDMSAGRLRGEIYPLWTMENWGLLTDSMRRLTEGIISYLELQKAQKTSDRQEIFGRLYGYRQQLFDSLFAKRFTQKSDFLSKEMTEKKSELPLLRGYDRLDSGALFVAAKNWADSNIDMGEPLAETASLTRLENEVLLSERILLLFCNREATSTHHYDEAHPIIEMSSNSVKAGDVIEVTAGVGLFYYQFQPSLVINGKEVKPDNGGSIVVHKMKVNGKPGKHLLSLRLIWYKPDGSRAWIDKDLEYTILSS